MNAQRTADKRARDKAQKEVLDKSDYSDSDFQDDTSDMTPVKTKQDKSTNCISPSYTPH